MKLFFKPIPLALLLFTIYLTWVCGSLLGYDEAGNLITHSYSIWGDWSAHFSFISGLRERGPGWIGGENPLFSGVPFQYPFLSHLLTALFSFLTRLDVVRSTQILSLILLAILPYTLYRFHRSLGLSPYAGFASTLSFILIGGFQIFDSSLKSTEPLTNQFQDGSVLTQFVLFELFPQRAFLFGLLMLSGLFLYFRKQETWSFKNISILVIAFSLTALTHVHTWISLSTLAVFILIFPHPLLREKITRFQVLKVGLLIAALSSLCLSFLLLRGNQSDHHSSWQIWFPGWAQNPGANLKGAQEMNFFSFWLYNSALYLPLALGGMYFSRKNKLLLPFAASGILLFVIALLFNIQPYFYDNLKLITYAFFFFSPFVGIAIEKCGPLWISIPLLTLQISTGASDFESFRNHLQNATFFSRDEIELAEKFKLLRRSPESKILIEPRHNHWVPCLSGNPIVMGYGGWLWTWGIDASVREKEVQKVLMGEANSQEVLDLLQVEYVILQERSLPPNSRAIAELQSAYKDILSGSGWHVYSVSEKLKSPTSSVR